MVTCPSCGYENPETARFCTNCGRALGEAPAPVVSYASQDGIDRTRTGLLLLTIGFVLYAIPLANFVGVVLVLVAVILVYMGAEAVGPRHRTFALWAILSFIIILIAAGIALVTITALLIAAEVSGQSQAQMYPLWVGAAGVLGAAVALLVLPYALITWELQGDRGRQVITVAIGVDVSLGVVSALYFASLFDAFLGALQGNFNDLAALTSDPLLQYVVPLGNLVWAYAYYLAYRRVRNGAIFRPPGSSPPALSERLPPP